MRHRETFQTHAEAEAFIRGIEFVDNDHVSTEGPEPELDAIISFAIGRVAVVALESDRVNDYGQPEYAVYVTEFA